MAAITVSNQKNKMNVDSRVVTREVTLGAGTSGDTIDVKPELGLRDVVAVWKDVTATFDFASGTVTTDANTDAGVYRFEGK